VDVVLYARLLSQSSRVPNVDAVYSSHCLEHFTPDDADVVLAGFHSVLKPGGTVEIHVPDGDEIDRLESEVGLHGVAYESPAGPITPFDMRHGHQASIKDNPHMAHQNVFTACTLKAAVEAAGFKDVRVEARDLELAAFGMRD